MFFPLCPLSLAYTTLARRVGCGFRQTRYESCSEDEMHKALSLRKDLAQRKVLIILGVVLCCCSYHCWHYRTLKNLLCEEGQRTLWVEGLLWESHESWAARGVCGKQQDGTPSILLIHWWYSQICHIQLGSFRGNKAQYSHQKWIYLL